MYSGSHPAPRKGPGGWRGKRCREEPGDGGQGKPQAQVGVPGTLPRPRLRLALPACRQARHRGGLGDPQGLAHRPRPRRRGGRALPREGVAEGWIERLWQAFLDDEIPYIERLADSWGELCASPERASRQADELLPDLRAAWADPRPGAYFRGTTACLSCLLAAGRHRELLDLLEQAPFVWWHNRVYGVRALAAMGRTDEALDYAGASLGRSDSPAAMARTCEEILLEAGRRDEAYQRYALQATRRSSRLATFRAIATTYPDRDKEGILNDLIRSTPGEEEKWFATARHLGLHDLAVVLANRSPCDPRTLNRAARDHLADHPRFALEVSLAALRWLAEGWGYEITSADIHAARACAVEAAEALGESDRTLARNPGPG